MALRVPRPLRGKCLREAIKKKSRFEGGGQIRGIRGAIKEKGRFERGGQIRGIWP